VELRHIVVTNSPPEDAYVAAQSNSKPQLLRLFRNTQRAGLTEYPEQPLYDEVVCHFAT
jgi:hypothetical protein